MRGEVCLECFQLLGVCLRRRPRFGAAKHISRKPGKTVRGVADVQGLKTHHITPPLLQIDSCSTRFHTGQGNQQA